MSKIPIFIFLAVIVAYGETVTEIICKTCQLGCQLPSIADPDNLVSGQSQQSTIQTPHIWCSPQVVTIRT